jgi:magnesium and cobalt exporter, CNNM family
MGIGFNLTAVVLLLAANAFFVAAEFALVKAKGFRVEALAAEGSRAAGMTLRIQANLEAYLAACQLGITMASLGLGWVGEPAVAALLEPLFRWAGMPERALHTVAFVTGFLIFSSLHIVVGEQVPKTFAIRKPEPVSVWTAYPLHATYIAVWPLNWLLNRASGAILGLFGVKEASHAEVYSNDELKGMVDTSREHGEIEHDRATMLKNLFELDQRQVGRVMVPRTHVAVLDVDGTAERNLEVIREGSHSRFPVLSSKQEDEIVGLLLVKDVYSALMAGDEQPWGDLQRFAREPMVVPVTQKIPDLFELMRSKRAHMAFVVDEYGKFMGIVTLEDLLEEIVGEIEDETDDTDPKLGIVATGEGQWEAAGLASLGDVERELGMVIPPELDANTLSGLFLIRLERMPQANDEIVEGGYTLRVLDVEDRHVGRVAIQRVGFGG